MATRLDALDIANARLKQEKKELGEKSGSHRGRSNHTLPHGKQAIASMQNHNATLQSITSYQQHGKHHHGASTSGSFEHWLPCSRPRVCMPNAEEAPLLVYHPQGGLGNCLFGMSSAALLATLLCRRFALSWGQNANRQAGAAYTSLFQRAEGLAFVNASEGAKLVSALGGTEANCTMQLNPVTWDPRQSLASPASLQNLTVDGVAGKVKASRCPVLHVRGNMYYAPVLERSLLMARASRWLRTNGLGCAGGGSSRDPGNTSSSSRSSSSSSSSGGAHATVGAFSTADTGSLTIQSAAQNGVGEGGSQGPVKRGTRRYNDEPYFAAISRHLFVPRNASTHRANAAIERTLEPDVAVIGVHVRSTILLALHKERRVNVSSSVSSLKGLLSAYGFLECISAVRNESIAAGYKSSRIYLAADNPLLREEAMDNLGAANIVPPPGYLYTGREARGRMTTIRGAVSTAGAVDEMLLLTRLDGLIVWDLKDSTYSAVAASWAAHRVGIQPEATLRQPRKWLGVYTTIHGCVRIPDAEVEPPAHKRVAHDGVS